MKLIHFAFLGATVAAGAALISLGCATTKDECIRYVCNPADFGCTQPFWMPPPLWDGGCPNFGRKDAGGQ